MTKIPVGLQLYSLRDACKEDFYKTIRLVKEIGYDGVEFAGFFGKPAKEVRRVVEDAGLLILGAHTSLDQLLPDKFDATVEYHKELGNNGLVVPSLGVEYRRAAADCRKTAELLTGICQRLTALGLVTGYHPHEFDVEPLDDGGKPTTVYDEIMANTPAEFVMQIDVGNVKAAGVCPVSFIKRYPGRAAQIHLKESRPGAPVKWNIPLGGGDVPWAAVFEAAAAVGGVKSYVVEVEQYWDDPAECCRQDRALLRNLGV